MKKLNFIRDISSNKDNKDTNFKIKFFKIREFFCTTAYEDFCDLFVKL